MNTRKTPAVIETKRNGATAKRQPALIGTNEPEVEAVVKTEVTVVGKRVGTAL